MVKAHFVFIISITSGFLLTIQLIALQYLVHQAAIEEPAQWKILDLVTNVAQQQNIPVFVIDPSVLKAIENGTHLLEHAARQPRERPSRRKGRLSKLEQARLDSDFYERNSLVDSNCRVFCSSTRKITHLATLADFVSQEAIGHLTTLLSEHHRLTVISLTDTDPTLQHLNLHVTIPTHLLIVDEDVDIRKESHVVHITILHDRIRGRYWWQAPMKISENQERILHRQGLKRTVFHTSSSAIFPKTEVLRTTIDGLNIFLPLPADPFLVPPEDKQFIECNLKRSVEFYSQYPKEDSYEANQFRNKAHALLTKVRHLLEDDLHIPFWLSSGTLLGYYRQCDFIVYSGDVDIGIWADDYRPEIIEVFSDNNIPLIHWFGRPNDSLELSFVSGDLKLDIFFFYRESDHYWNGGTQARTGLKFKYDFPKFTLCWTEFAGLLLRVPCQTESYIEANYGKDWFTPVKTWDWKASPPNVRPNGQWGPHEWPETVRLIPIPKF